MTVTEIIAMAQLQSEEVYDDATWIKYINACLYDLTPVIKLLNTKANIVATLTSGSCDISISADQDLAKAASFLYAYFTPAAGVSEQLRRLPISDNVSRGWKQTQTTISLQNCGSDSGTLRLDYYKALQPVSKTSDDLLTVSGLPEQYHHMVVLYCVAKSQQKEEELDDANNAYSEYMLGKKQLTYDRMWEMEPHMRRRLRRAKLAAMLS